MSEKILVVAFDGLDKKLIEKYNLENIRQQEFGKIDNSTGISSIKTSELFASFITGETYEEHGIKDLKTTSGRQKLIDNSIPDFLKKNVRGFTRLQKVLQTMLRVDEGMKYAKEHLQLDSVFEKIEDSRPMFIPGYNPSIFWVVNADLDPMRYGYSTEEAAKHYDNREYRHRKDRLFSELENEIIGSREFLMCHFHTTDTYQHLYGDKDAVYDEKKLKRLYEETDEFAGEIKQKALEKGYDYVIFMSDHGLPTEKGHNENAFYSCNRDLFGDETPQITDFHNKILELTGNGEKKNG